jgi:O-antigen ligase
MRVAAVRAASVPRAPSAAEIAVPAALGAAALLAVWALFFGGGSDDPVWLGATALILAATAASAALLGALPWPSPGPYGIAFVALLAAFVVWNGVTVSWSILPDRSWSYTNRGLVYLGFVCVGLFVGAYVPRAPRRLALALAALLGLVLGWALLGKVIPSLFPDGARVARLRSPVGYWNALALLGDVALVLGLWIASRRGADRGLRVGGALLSYAAVVTVLLTYSRAAVVVGALAVAFWVALARPRLDSLAAFVVAAVPAGLVAALATTSAGLTDDNQPHDARVRGGIFFALLLVAGAAVVIGAAVSLLRYEAARPLPRARRRLLIGRTLIAIGAAVVLGLVASVARAGGPADWIDARTNEFTNVQQQPTQGPSRIGSFSSANRWTWWKESWWAFSDRPLQGTGAGSFELAHRLERRDFSPPGKEPHNMVLQFLSETGLVGFGLFVGAVVAAALGVRDSLRRVGAADRVAGIALSAGLVAYALHGLVDFHWDFVAVTGPMLLVVGALLGAGRAPVTRPAAQPLWAVGAGALAVAAVFSLASPWLAERKLEEALTARSGAERIRAAKEAHSLNPLAVEPLLIWANAEPDIPEAKEVFRKATAIQPENPQVWYEFGVFELEVDNFPKRAYELLNRSYTLDRFGPASEPGGPLDVAREEVNKAAARDAANRRRRGRDAPPASPSE